MLVDNPLYAHQQPFPLPGPSFDDFFNMDMASNSSHSSHSRSPSPKSPQSFPAYTMSSPQIAQDNPDSFFNFYLDDDYSKDINMGLGFGSLMAPPPSMGSAPYDFLSAFSSSSSSSGSPASLASMSQSPDQPFAIDPQLVGTPSTSKAESDFGDDDDEQQHQYQQQEEEEEEEKVVVPIKVAGHGKLRKGTVQSGGITKKSFPAAVKDKENAVVSQVVKKPGTSKDEDGDDMDDWRPSPEEYKKMSSKEKRQLRNKISARNFRVRRKEYISTLEGDIAERDRLLSAIRTELGSTQSENVALRQEIAALKRALLAGRGTEEQPVLPPPGPLPISSPSPMPAHTPVSSSLLTANTQKDLASKNKAFWGGVGGGMGMGGITSVHTAIMPEVSVGLGLSRKPLEGRNNSSLLENLNPAMNGGAVEEKEKKDLALMGSGGGFEGFADSNMFTLKTLDAYRMQLWGKMAAQTHAHQASQQRSQSHHQHQPQPHLTGLASNMRPHYFHGSSVGLSGLLSGKAMVGGSSYPTPPSTPPMLGKVLSNTTTNIPITSPPPPSSTTINVTAGPSKPTQEQAMLAAMASQTLIKRLGSAFWEAFSGSGSGHGHNSNNNHHVHMHKAWDADKVRRVLEGKAVVKVVDVEQPPSVSSPSSPSSLSQSLSSLSLSSPVVATKSAASSPVVPSPAATSTTTNSENERACCKVLLHDILEESMRSLSLGKKA